MFLNEYNKVTEHGVQIYRLHATLCVSDVAICVCGIHIIFKQKQQKYKNS